VSPTERNGAEKKARHRLIQRRRQMKKEGQARVAGRSAKGRRRAADAMGFQQRAERRTRRSRTA
jgi:hypothetical protein